MPLMPTHDPKQRQDERLPVSLGARLRTAQGGAADGVLTNLSENGCSVHVSASFLHEGSHVAVQMQGLNGLAGIVRWTKGNFLGIEFASALHVAVVEHMSKTSTVRLSVSG